MNRAVELDRCPGVLRPYLAVDGNMVRFRCPGGFITATQLLDVVELSMRYSNGEVQLTSRNNLQLRALPDPVPGQFVAEAFATGLMPAAAHERVRTIICSPLTSVAPAEADLSGVSEALDQRLTSEPALADLPGRFLFVLDDGRGDVLGEAFDLAYQAGPNGTGWVFVGGVEAAVQIAADEAVETLITLAIAFVAVNSQREKPAWHTREFDDPTALLRGVGPLIPHDRPSREVPVALGAVHGAASVGVPLGLLTPAQAKALAGVAERVGAERLIVTPWRGVIVPGAAQKLDDLAAAGLVVTEDSVWAMLTACYGKPCNNALCDTRAIAEEVAQSHPGRFAEHVHISGCDRVCGEPGGQHVSLIAPADAPQVLRAALR